MPKSYGERFSDLPSRPRVFIGSSRESLEVAEAIQQNLDHNAEVEIWSQGGFGPTESSLLSLLGVADRIDFAIVVPQADDQLETRGQSRRVARDNLIFELGLLIGGGLLHDPVTSELRCREVPLEGCSPCPGPIPESSART